MQATMFQPVGGMDRIAYAFAKSLGSIARFNAPVTEIRKTGSGVRVGYMQNGSPRVIEARLLHLRAAAGDPAENSQRLQRAVQEGCRRMLLLLRVQGRVGKPALLGAGLQHLRGPRVLQRRTEPDLASFGWDVQRTWRAGERLWLRHAARLRRTQLCRQTRRESQVDRAAASWARQRAGEAAVRELGDDSVQRGRVDQ